MSDGGSSDPRWRLGAEEVAAGFVERVAELRRVEAEIYADIAEMGNRGVAEELGYGSVEKLIVELGRVGLGEARRMVRRACALNESVGVSGSVPAELPATAEALADGEVSAQHVDAILALHRDLPDDVEPELWEIAETTLADIARTVPPRGLARPIEELRSRLDPDGAQPSEAELARPDRGLRTGWLGDRFRVNGEFDREAGLMIQAALGPLSAPRDADDRRPTEERYGDALVELVSTAVDAQRLPAEGGGAVTIFLTMQEESLRERIGAATTMDGDRIPVEQVRRVACDAGVIPTLLGRAGEVLDMGSRARTAPTSVRNRLIVRDRGCAFPGCHHPPSRTQAHHIVHWVSGGLSTVDNMVLLCRHHHRVVHHADWEVRLRDGTPEFIPPAYLDPLRRPRRQALIQAAS